MTDDTDIMARMLASYSPKNGYKTLTAKHMQDAVRKVEDDAFLVGIDPAAPHSVVSPYSSSDLDFSQTTFRAELRSAFHFSTPHQRTIRIPTHKPKEAPQMFIYKIQQRGPVGWDENAEFLVAAVNAKQARKGVADAFVKGMGGDEGLGTWLNTKKSKVTRLGFYRPSHPAKAYYAQQPVVLMRNFRAG